jgi:hypothetical protein
MLRTAGTGMQRDSAKEEAVELRRNAFGRGRKGTSVWLYPFGEFLPESGPVLKQ